jgi:hypothetical protein
MFFPSLGHPYFGPKRLHEEKARKRRQNNERRNIVFGSFMDII